MLRVLGTARAEQLPPLSETRMKSRKARRHRRAAKLARVIDERGPTPETLAHHKPDTYQSLIDLGWIDAAGQRAGDEIVRIWNALTHELEAKCSSFSSIERGVRDMPDEIARAYSDRYKPWVADISPAHELVISLVTGRGDTKSTELQKVICDGLRNYARRF